MTQYDKTFTLPFVLPPEHPDNILADVMARLKWKNLRVAETEKYAHVTYFFNGGNEKPYAGEERELVASPKVATYDLKPEMSAPGITDKVVKAIEQGGFDVIVMNYRECGYGGPLGQARADDSRRGSGGCGSGRDLRGAETVRRVWLITADHGNAEMMIDPMTKGPHTYHTTNPVPFIFMTNDGVKLRAGGALRDIAPTVLGILGIEKPAQMKGEDLRVS